MSLHEQKSKKNLVQVVRQKVLQFLQLFIEGTVPEQ